MQIRKGTREDLPKIIEIYMKAYEKMPEYGEKSRKEAKRYIKWLYSRCKDTFYIAEEDGKIVGFVFADPEWYSYYGNKYVFAIHEIVVDPKYQGRGIGTALMKKMLEEAREREVELWVGERNKKAQEFYKKFGFKPAGIYGIWLRMVLHKSGKGDAKN